MMLSVCRRFMITALPTLFAACSRLIRCRSTSTCFSSAERSCSNSEKESCISGSSSTRGLISSRIWVRSAFFAQPGKGALPKIARQPDPAADHDLMVRPFAAQPFAARRHDVGEFHPLNCLLVFELLDLIAQGRGTFVIFFRDRFLQIFGQARAFDRPARSRDAARCGKFADMLGALVHRLEQTPKPSANVT